MGTMTKWPVQSKPDILRALNLTFKAMIAKIAFAFRDVCLYYFNERQFVVKRFKRFVHATVPLFCVLRMRSKSVSLVSTELKLVTHYKVIFIIF